MVTAALLVFAFAAAFVVVDDGVLGCLSFFPVLVVANGLVIYCNFGLTTFDGDIRERL